ncbi:MAG: sigma-54-dependent Fis family transcriptional regulator [Ignavibacteriales bacterium]|nr:sigma-54-dependent Fis family transcriptional regulator [Ignavibacteriales bacterium]
MNREEFQQQHGIIGESTEIQELVDVIQQVAPTELAVLITGESGTGKEVVAKAIHNSSLRKNKTLVSVNAGAIPEGIIESELFGHEKGAFTGASETRKGYFEQADGGTIFLDEIGEMPLATQVKFLRVLESGEFTRVGSAVPRKTNVRVIAATNKDLEWEVEQKHFRADLFYRLRSVNIHIPSLRERRDDIPMLMEFFAKEFSEQNKILFEGFSDDAIEIFRNAQWNGNVRELKNIIQSMLVVEKGKRIEIDDARKYVHDFIFKNGRSKNLPVYTAKTVEQAERELLYRALLDLKSGIIDLKSFLEDRLGVSAKVYDGEGKLLSPLNQTQTISANINDEMSLAEMEKKMIRDAYTKFNGKKSKMAEVLGVSERSLYRKVRELGLE